MIAFFTLVRSRDITPAVMFTIVSFSEVCNNLVDLLFSSHTSSRDITSDDLIRSSHKAIFVPLITGTSLPALPANIASDISKLSEKGKKRITRIVHCRNSCA